MDRRYNFIGSLESHESNEIILVSTKNKSKNGYLYNEPDINIIEQIFDYEKSIPIVKL